MDPLYAWGKLTKKVHSPCRCWWHHLVWCQTNNLSMTKDRCWWLLSNHICLERKQILYCEPNISFKNEFTTAQIQPYQDNQTKSQATQQDLPNWSLAQSKSKGFYLSGAYNILHNGPGDILVICPSPTRNRSVKLPTSRLTANVIRMGNYDSLLLLSWCNL